MPDAKLPKPSREKFDSLRAAYLAKAARQTELELNASSQCGPGWQLVWLKAGDRRKLEAAREARAVAGDRIFEYVQLISPRDWSAGVPVHWVCEKLTFEDAVRPLSEKLSVVPPLAFGATEPMR